MVVVWGGGGSVWRTQKRTGKREENEEKEKRGETCEGSERTGDKDKRKEMEGKGWVA